MMIAAQATPDHATHFANFAQLASDNFFSVLLGSRANQVLEKTFLHPNNENSYDITHFLIENDAIVGMVNGYSYQQKQAMNGKTDQLIRKYAGWQYLQYLALGLYLHNMIRFIGGNLGKDDFYIQMVAIYSDFRGRGHSKTLLSHAHDVARQAGCSRLALDVVDTNTVAISAYEGVGFTVIDKSSTINDGDKDFTTLRMVKDIV